MTADAAEEPDLAARVCSLRFRRVGQPLGTSFVSGGKNPLRGEINIECNASGSEKRDHSGDPKPLGDATDGTRSSRESA